MFGYGKPAESIIGHRILHEEDGYADLLLLRRNFQGRGFFFEIDATLQQIDERESELLHKKVHRTVEMLMSESAQSVAVHADLNIDEVWEPLLAAVGAVSLALATINDLVISLRDRAEEARTGALSRVEARFAHLAKLQEDLPEQVTGLRDKLTTEEVRKAVESYLEATTSRYNELVERGQAAMQSLRNLSGPEATLMRTEGYVEQAIELTQETAGTVASQTRAVGERAAKLVGIELPKKAQATAKAPAKKKPPKKAPAKKSASVEKVASTRKAPARKTPAKKATRRTPRQRG